MPNDRKKSLNPRAKTEALFARVSSEFHADFANAVKTENAMLGNYEERGMSEVIRELCEEYIKKVTAIAESEAAQMAAQVLKRGKRAVKRA